MKTTEQLICEAIEMGDIIYTIFFENDAIYVEKWQITRKISGYDSVYELEKIPEEKYQSKYARMFYNPISDGIMSINLNQAATSDPSKIPAIKEKMVENALRSLVTRIEVYGEELALRKVEGRPTSEIISKLNRIKDRYMIERDRLEQYLD